MRLIEPRARRWRCCDLPRPWSRRSFEDVRNGRPGWRPGRRLPADCPRRRRVQPRDRRSGWPTDRPDVRYPRRWPLAVWWTAQPTSLHFSGGRTRGGIETRTCRRSLKLVGGSETAPVPAVDADRHVDLAHHDGLAAAHVAGVALDQVG